VKAKLVALCFGAGIGFVMAWARVTDPAVIRSMLLLHEYDVFLLMGCAICVAAVGARVLRAANARALVSGEPIRWDLEKPRAQHVVGSVLFGAGWSVAGTCPGPVAAMVGEGRLGGALVAAGLLAGVLLQRALTQSRTSSLPATVQDANRVGL
jgi:uncharacterized membrane protein YedE/YeeE